jgi:hypothetical protein
LRNKLASSKDGSFHQRQPQLKLGRFRISYSEPSKVAARRAAHRDGSASSGGESDLNLFINDVKKDPSRRSTTVAATILSHELERLHGLLVRGAISQAEFDGLKAKLLGASALR